ncbi:MAG: FAD-binding oxidoreductase, partial [Actinobacteria bacterium]|nr:FAD-binding oxidoreductase [Actinomycetota bacterium]
MADIATQLAEVVGANHVITDPAVMEPYLVDWTRRYRGDARCVVRPGSTDEVASVLRMCSAAGVPVVVQGGNTGLVGGAIPGEGLPVVLSTRRLDWIGDVDQRAGQLSAGAGATLGAVQRAAASAGWVYGVDLAGRDSATIGGTVATNAGGIHVVAFGMTRAQVVGIEAVLADGIVLSHLSGLLKDNTGLDLGALLCGSEGTLAVITAVRVRLHRPVGATTVALIGSPSYADAVDLVQTAVVPGARVIGAEVVDDTGMRLVEGVIGQPYPLSERHPLVVLLEVADGGTGEGFIGLEDRDVVVGIDAGERARLWRYREAQADAFALLGVLHKLDVSVPLSALPACAEELNSLLGADAGVTEHGIFGHIGDGNLHVEFAGPSADDYRMDRVVLECVARYDGSVSAEHGIGRAK